MAEPTYVNNSAEAKRIRLDFAPEEGCHAGRDGECYWKTCPQERNKGANYQSFCCPLAHVYEEM